MLGLMVLGFFAFYFGVSFWLTRATWRWAKNNRRSKAWAYWVGFAIYNLVFWDWIPTLVVHEYLCSTQAGVTVYKTPEEWRQEHPELTPEMLKVKFEDINDFKTRKVENRKSKYAEEINSRIFYGFSLKKLDINLPITEEASYFFDIATNETLIEQINFSSGYGNPMTTGGVLGFKGWLARIKCSQLEISQRVFVEQYIKRIISLGE